MQSIGTVRSTRKKAEDDNWDSEEAYVELDSSQFSGEALAGLNDFSHVEIIFYMDQVDALASRKPEMKTRGARAALRRKSSTRPAGRQIACAELLPSLRNNPAEEGFRDLFWGLKQDIPRAHIIAGRREAGF